MDLIATFLGLFSYMLTSLSGVSICSYLSSEIEKYLGFENNSFDPIFYDFPMLYFSNIKLGLKLDLAEICFSNENLVFD